MAFRLGIDLGTSTTVAVLGGPSSTRPLLFDASPLLSSAVFAGAGPALLTGLDAQRAAIARPAGLEANPKRRIDEGTIWLGEREYPVVEVLAAILRRVTDEARRVAGEPIAETVLTHPAAWGRTRLGLLADAAARAGVPGRPGDVGLVPEPVAAAAYFAAARDLAPGQSLVVYDLGAGTFDVSVVRRGGGAGDFEVLATGGLADVGGLDLDAAVVQHARALTAGAAPAWGRLDWPQDHADRQARHGLWAGARAAKEQLSRHATAELHLPLVGADLHLTREEFERAARPYLDRTVALSMAVLRDAGVPPERIGGVFLVGGSSRIPLAATLLHRALRIAPTIVDQPELVVAEGSLLAPVAHASAAPPTGALRPVSPVPVSPAHISPAPVSPAPVFPAPVSPVPVSPAPVSPVPIPAAVAVAAPAPVPPAIPAPVSPAPFAAAPASPAPAARAPASAPPTAGPAPRPARWRRPALVALVVVLLAAAVAGGRLWLSGRGPVLAELRGHAGPVRAVAFSPDGRLLATAGDDRTVRLWDVAGRAASGAPVSTPSPLRAVAFSPDGRTLAAAGQDQRIRVWDLATRRERDLGDGRVPAVNALAFDKDGTMLAAGGDGGDAVVYDLASGAKLAELGALRGGTVNAVAFSPRDPDRIVLGGDKPAIAAYSTTDRGRALAVEAATRHSGAIRAVAYSPDGATVASAGADGDVLLWPLDQAGIAAGRLAGNGGGLNAVAFDRTGRILAAAGDDRRVRVWDASSRALTARYDQCRSEIDALAFSPAQTKVFATGSRDGVVRLWSAS